MANPSYKKTDVTPPDTGGGDYGDNYNHIIVSFFLFSLPPFALSPFLSSISFTFPLVMRVRIPAECVLKSLSFRTQAYNSRSAESILTKLYTGEFCKKLLLRLQ